MLFIYSATDRISMTFFKINRATAELKERQKIVEKLATRVLEDSGKLRSNSKLPYQQYKENSDRVYAIEMIVLTQQNRNYEFNRIKESVRNKTLLGALSLTVGIILTASSVVSTAPISAPIIAGVIGGSLLGIALGQRFAIRSTFMKMFCKLEKLERELKQRLGELSQIEKPNQTTASSKSSQS
jgi:hypothetical protein